MTAHSGPGYPRLAMTVSNQQTSEFKDRTAGLIVFGAVSILIGACCALLVPLMFLSVSLSESVAGSGVDARSAWSASALYGIIAVAFVWLGIGSIRARRWACELLLSLSWIWLLTGICSMIIGLLVLPTFIRELGGEPTLPTEMAPFVYVVIFVVFALLYVVLPALFVIFYRSPHVAATCCARWPDPQWIDRCPRRLLTLMVVWALLAVSALLMPAYNFFLPFFGIVLTGAVGGFFWALVAATCGVLAIGTYRRALWAWWGGLALTLAGTISSIVVALRYDHLEVLSMMKLPEDQMAVMKTFPILDRWVVALGAVVVWGTFIVYLMTLRRFFTPMPISEDV